MRLGSKGVEPEVTRAGQRDPVPSAVPRTVVALCYGLVCHGCFVLAVGAMMAAMFFGMSRSLGSLASPWSGIANAVLIVQFPLVHSLLLTKKGRALLGRLAPGGNGKTLSSTTYVIVASLQIVMLFAFWTPSGEIWWRAQG